jgi:excisionase family DNA binding protein
MENENKKRLFTIREAAKVVDGLTEYRIRQMCREGKIRFLKAGKKILIGEEALLQAAFGGTSDTETECSKKSCNLPL